MSAFLASQTLLFLESILLGGMLSLFYDFFAVARMMFPQRVNPHVLLDIMYFLLVGMILFDYVLLENQGRMRFFIALGAAIGWVIYHLTVSRLVIKCASWMIRQILWLLRLLVRPLSPLVNKLGRAGKKVKTIAASRKNQLKYSLKRRIRLLYNKATSRRRKENGHEENNEHQPYEPSP